jgi:hypothetical protein
MLQDLDIITTQSQDAQPKVNMHNAPMCCCDGLSVPGQTMTTLLLYFTQLPSVIAGFEPLVL